MQVPQLDAATDPLRPLHARPPLSQTDNRTTKNRDSMKYQIGAG
jgi:hypothetical protein